ncbi:MAG: DHA2 family efflux MFS transporter permease subunit [Rhizobiaceae bacterium]
MTNTESIVVDTVQNRDWCPVEVRKYVVIVSILASSLAFVDGTIVTVAMPKMREALGASLPVAQWILNGYALSLSAFLLLGGAAGDAYGLRGVFMAGIAIFGAASLLCGLAPDANWLVAGRVLQGLGGALMVPGSLALISENFPPEERGKAIGTWAAASGIAAALGPILGGWIIDLGPWRMIFLINLPVTVVAIWLCWRFVPSSLRDPDTRMDWLGGVLVVIGLGGLTYGLTALGDNKSFGSIETLALSAGFVFLVLFLLHQRRTTSPMMPLYFFRSRLFSGVNLLTFLLYFALSGALVLLPTTLIAAHSYSATEAGSVFLPFTLMMALLSRIGGILGDRFGMRWLLTIGPVITGLSFLALVPATAHGGYWLAITPAMLLMGLGMGITVAPLSTAIMNAVATHHAGVASGINNAISRVAGLIAVASLGVFAATGFEATLSGNPAISDVLKQIGFGVVPEVASNAFKLEGFQAALTAANLSGFASVAIPCGILAIISGLVGYFSVKDSSVAGSGQTNDG